MDVELIDPIILPILIKEFSIQYVRLKFRYYFLIHLCNEGYFWLFFSLKFLKLLNFVNFMDHSAFSVNFWENKKYTAPPIL